MSRLGDLIKLERTRRGLSAKQVAKKCGVSEKYLLDVELGSEEEYVIVGGQEADPFSGRISNDSPVGRALIGAKVGESIMADTPAGALEFKVLSVTKAE